MDTLVAIALVILGLAVGLLGYKLFRAVMPVAGLVVGATIGFTGFQAMFGTGVTSTTVAILVAAVFGLVLAVLSFAFFDIAVTILLGSAFASLFTLLGMAFGLSNFGFVMGMLSLAGFIVGIVLGSSSAFLSESLVTLVTAYIGSGIVLAGVFLLFTGVSLETMYDNGVLATASQYASDSFWWVLVWIASIVIMRQIQLNSLPLEMFPEDWAYTEATRK